MGSVVLNHVPEQIDCKMLGGTRNSEYTRASQLEGGSRSTSSNSTPTSTTAPPTAVGSARLPAHLDVPAYINSQTPSQSSTRTPSDHPSHPAPSMTSHSNHGAARDHPSYPNTATSQYSGHAASDSMTSAPNPYSRASPAPESPRLQPTFRSMQSLGGSEANSPSRIRVQSLSHIQSLASEEFLARSHAPGHGTQPRHFEISSMPVTEIIEMVAGLLTKITTTNDTHHEHVHRHIPPPDGASNLSPQATSVLAFHGKNVPSITILSYLTRIHKYCPTTYEVFLSLLVYFDRMTELVSRGKQDPIQQRYEPSPQPNSEQYHSSAGRQAQDSSIVTPPSSAGMTASDPKGPNAFNIHRLVISGVTCASKFFSDVFYTNSRYAKVGGLPLVELNHLELQFLLLNDFRLAIPVEELEAYGTMLVEFYAREVVVQQQQMASPRAIPPSMSDSQSDVMYMRSRDKRRDHEMGQTPTPP
ncbi:uncharacterized protein N7498_005148 [Penicillium cinerascens]|uniref:Cyclin-domain-containing protein n=1 Tax=Penicillium cinerascens TaxID=70096 RepID=A0A9W9MMW9_9EURO|nr:uncharacterized protein N7498_005148 [Penicillium cinerascens]KAJ5204269.1 hypothetical protein N7498_005148 [Penicillium cinerascens]